MYEDSYRLLTIKDVSRILSISIRHLRRMIAGGSIPVIRLGHRTLRFELEEVLAALKTISKGRQLLTDSNVIKQKQINL